MNTNRCDVKKQQHEAPLWTKGFFALLITQFLVALNDNIVRWLVIPIGKSLVGWGNQPAEDQVRMIGSLAFLVPFLLFTSYAGYCSDRFDRRKVIIHCKIAELLIVLLGTVAILMQNIPFMFVVLFLLATQSAFFSPAKYSSLPSVVPESRISEANGYYSMTTMVACIVGQLLGGFLFVWTTLLPEKPEIGTGGQSHWFIWAAVIVGVAVVGLISSFFIPTLKAVDPKAKFPLNPFYQTFADLRFLFRHRTVFWVGLGSAFFWGLGALAQVNIDKFATGMLSVRQDYAMFLLVALTIGLAGGALLAGFWSRGRIEMGLVPLGILLIIVFLVFLSLTPSVSPAPGESVASPLSFGFLYGAAGLFFLGISAGMYDIPLLATLQTKSPVESRGRILAAYNFYSFAAMAIFSVIQGILAAPPKALTFGFSLPGLGADQIWLVCALLTLPIFVISLRWLLAPCLSVLIAAILWGVYRPRILNRNEIPEEGPALLVGNHVSFLDALFLHCVSRRPLRFIADAQFVPDTFWGRFAARHTRSILFRRDDPRSAVKMIREARSALEQGDVLVIFPEGGITRTGQIRSFEPGFLSILKGNDQVPIVPFWLGGLWGSRWSYAKPKYRVPSWLRRIQRVTVAFGRPVTLTESDGKYRDLLRMRHLVEELGADSMDPLRFPKDRHILVPQRLMIRIARHYRRQLRFADSTGTELNGRQSLLRMLVLRRLLNNQIKQDQFVGVLMPTSVAGVLTNAAVLLDRKVPVNLNYTFSNETNNYCLEKAGIHHIIVTKRLLQRLPNLKLNAKMIVLEDLAASIPLHVKLLAFLESLLPVSILERLLGLTKIRLSDPNTIVFTSGSTGLPKGALLSHSNVMANVRGFYETVRPNREDRLLGTLPLFHSFGYTTMLMFPLTHPLSGIYHFNPLDPKGVGAMARKYKTTISASTPTFIRNYLRRCEPEDFATLDLFAAGAEKLPIDLAQKWREKFGHYLVEGFGATELSPVLSYNMPPCRWHDTFNKYYREGAIGRPQSCFVVRITDPETGEELPANTPGMLELKGASVIREYYNDPEKTRDAFHQGWYSTGDIAQIDDDGFIFITGRMVRISKIGGEMVPHILIEDRILEVLAAHETEEPVKQISVSKQESKQDKSKGASSEEGLGSVTLAVTAVPDQRKGEKLVVLYSHLSISPEQICKELQEKELPAIWIPSPNHFHAVKEIPVLGTGKLNLKAVKEMALALYRADDDPA